MSRERAHVTYSKRAVLGEYLADAGPGLTAKDTPSGKPGATQLFVEHRESALEGAHRAPDVALEALRVEPVELALDRRAPLRPLLALVELCSTMRACRELALRLRRHRFGLPEEGEISAIGVPVLRSRREVTGWVHEPAS